jgi:hypothetical protein
MLRPDFTNVVAVVNRTRRSPTTIVWSKFGLPDKRWRTIKRDKLMDGMRWTTGR